MQPANHSEQTSSGSSQFTTNQKQLRRNRRSRIRSITRTEKYHRKRSPLDVRQQARPISLCAAAAKETDSWTTSNFHSGKELDNTGAALFRPSPKCENPQFWPVQNQRNSPTSSSEVWNDIWLGKYWMSPIFWPYKYFTGDPFSECHWFFSIFIESIGFGCVGIFGAQEICKTLTCELYMTLRN